MAVYKLNKLVNITTMCKAKLSVKDVSLEKCKMEDIKKQGVTICEWTGSATPKYGKRSRGL